MSFDFPFVIDFPFVRLFGVRQFCYYPYLHIYMNTHLPGLVQVLQQKVAGLNYKMKKKVNYN